MLYDELLARIERYLNNKLTLKNLENWLLYNLQAILDSNDQLAIRVANEVDADFVQLSEGIIGESIIKMRLESYLAGREIHASLSKKGSTEYREYTGSADSTIIEGGRQKEILGSEADFRVLHLVA